MYTIIHKETGYYIHKNWQNDLNGQVFTEDVNEAVKFDKKEDAILYCEQEDEEVVKLENN